MNTKRSLVKNDLTESDRNTTKRRIQGMAAIRHVIVVAAACCVSLALTGCCTGRCDPLRMGSTCEQWHSDKMTRIDACLAWGGCNNRCANSEFASDIKRGFVAGYMATCSGGDGRIPMVPERRYWSNWYRCEYGQRCVNAWFMGYPMGVAAARQRGYHRLEAPEITLAQWRDPSTFTQMAPRPAVNQPAIDKTPPVLTAPEMPSQPGTFAVPVTPVPQTRENVAPEPPVNLEYDPQSINDDQTQDSEPEAPAVSVLPSPNSVDDEPRFEEDVSEEPRFEPDGETAPAPDYVVPRQVTRQPAPRRVLPQRQLPQANVPHSFGPGDWEELPPEFSGRGSVTEKPSRSRSRAGVDEMPEPADSARLDRNNK